MTQVAEQTDRSQYLADFDELTEETTLAWVADLRHVGAAAFAGMEFPHYKEEAWRNTNIKPILRSTFRAATQGFETAKDISEYSYADAGFTELVFVDGHFSQILSNVSDKPGDTEISSLSKAFMKTTGALKENLNQHVENTSAFVPLNTAFIQDGAYIEIPKNTKVEAPIHVLYISSGQEAVVTHPRNLFVIGESSEVNIVESYVGLPGTADYFTNAVTEIVVGDNAKVTRHKIVDDRVV